MDITLSGDGVPTGGSTAAARTPSTTFSTLRWELVESCLSPIPLQVSTHLRCQVDLPRTLEVVDGNFEVLEAFGIPSEPTLHLPEVIGDVGLTRLITA